MSNPLHPRTAACLPLLFLTWLLPAQGDAVPDGTPQPGAREAMWYAPTAADWQKPVLIQWQRSWRDAVRLSQQTKQPILVCVNMDGEIASEHYAGVRYRDREVADLYAPYVAVIASVYRHNPRDYDEQGRRIPCPRFGCVTCGEHMALEPVVYEKFLEGQRVAPRHIMVELDGSKAYDVYYRFDTASVFETITDGIRNRSMQAPPVVRGDRSLLDRVASPDSLDRQQVEAAFANGDSAQRQSLLSAALAQGEQAPLELLRQALYGLDAAQGQQARAGLAKSNLPEGADLIGEALRAPLPATEREQLVEALERLAPESPRARALARVHRGLAGRSTAVDVERWQQSLPGGASYAAAAEPEQPIDPSARLAEADRQSAADPNAPEPRIARAEASLAQAKQAGTDARMARLLLSDALSEAERAAALGAAAWRCDRVRALALQALGDLTGAYAAAERAGPTMPPDADDPLSAALLFLFAEARQEAIVAAHRQKQEWPRQWLTDVHATYSVLARHAHGTDEQVAHHYDFLRFFGGADAANKVLDDGLQRFAASPRLHERLRTRLLEEQGVEALRQTYAQLLAREGESSTLCWFAGYAALIEAEHERRRGRGEQALTAYQSGMTLFERALSLDPASRESCDHFVAMALSGRSRVHFENGNFEQSVTDLVAALQRRPEATPTLDGLNLSAADTVRTLQAKLASDGHAALAQRLSRAVDALDPALLALPAYERQGGTGTVPRPRRRAR